MRRIASAVVAIIFISITIPVQAIDVGKERAAVLEADKKWLSAVSDGRDIDLIASFWSDDAKIFAPGMPLISGKEAIRQFVQDSFATPGFSIRWETTEVVMSDDGSLAYTTGTNQSTFNDPKGQKVTLNGKSVAVWRKDASGRWKCIIDIWNENPGK